MYGKQKTYHALVVYDQTKLDFCQTETINGINVDSLLFHFCCFNFEVLPKFTKLVGKSPLKFWLVQIMFMVLLEVIDCWEDAIHEIVPAFEKQHK